MVCRCLLGLLLAARLRVTASLGLTGFFVSYLALAALAITLSRFGAAFCSTAGGLFAAALRRSFLVLAVGAALSAVAFGTTIDFRLAAGLGGVAALRDSTTAALALLVACLGCRAANRRRASRFARTAARHLHAAWLSHVAASGFVGTARGDLRDTACLRLAAS